MCGIDLDLSDRLALPSHVAVRSVTDAVGLPVRSIWLPERRRDAVRSRRHDQAVGLAVRLLSSGHGQTIVVRLPHLDFNDGLATIVRECLPLRERLSDSTRITLGLRPRLLAGGRGHLGDLGRLRHFVEEWDLDLALDLVGTVDLQWEAEAAITRILPRLHLVRVNAAVHPLRSRQDRLALRALSAVFDGGFLGDIAVAPAAGPWDQLHPMRCTLACQRVREQLTERHQRLIDRSFPDWTRLGHHHFG